MKRFRLYDPEIKLILRLCAMEILYLLPRLERKYRNKIKQYEQAKDYQRKLELRGELQEIAGDELRYLNALAALMAKLGRERGGRVPEVFFDFFDAQDRKDLKKAARKFWTE